MAYEKFRKVFDETLYNQCVFHDLDKPLTYKNAQNIAVKLTKEKIADEIEYGFLFNPDKIDKPHITRLFMTNKESGACNVAMHDKKKEGSFHTHPNDKQCIFSLEDIERDIGRLISIVCVNNDKEVYRNVDLRLRDKLNAEKIQHYKNLLQTAEEFGSLEDWEYDALEDLMNNIFNGDII